MLTRILVIMAFRTLSLALAFTVIASAFGCHFFNKNLQHNRVYTITSPWFPRPYPGNRYSCYYRATAPVGYKVKLYCNVFDILGNRGCGYSRFSFSPSGNTKFPDLVYRCGNFRQLAFKTTGNEFAAKFDNRYRNIHSQKGFKCFLWIDPLKPVTPPTKPTTTKPTTPKPTTKPTTTPKPTITTTSKCACGVRNSGSRIVGGNVTKKHEFPYMVGLGSINKGRVFCGASIISDEWLLTASHCVVDFTIPDLFVRIGGHDLSNKNEEGTYVLRVTKVIVHENYNDVTVDSDIALMKVSSKISFTDDVSPVCLPFKFPTNDFDGKTAIVTGWGTTTHQGFTSDLLKAVSIPVESATICERHEAMVDRVTQNMMCTYELDKDACQGDSGGPLVWSNNGRLYQIGIVSWGLECAKNGKPGVYTKVNNYLKWIEQKTGESFCKE